MNFNFETVATDCISLSRNPSRLSSKKIGRGNNLQTHFVFDVKFLPSLRYGWNDRRCRCFSPPIPSFDKYRSNSDRNEVKGGIFFC